MLYQTANLNAFLIAIAIIAGIVLVFMLVATFILLRSENRKENNRPKDEIKSIPPVEKSWLLRHPRKLDICVAQEDQSQHRDRILRRLQLRVGAQLIRGVPKSLLDFSCVGRHEGFSDCVHYTRPQAVKLMAIGLLFPHQISSSRRPRRRRPTCVTTAPGTRANCADASLLMSEI